MYKSFKLQTGIRILKIKRIFWLHYEVGCMISSWWQDRFITWLSPLRLTVRDSYLNALKCKLLQHYFLFYSRAFNQKLTPTHSRKLPAVTHVLIFQIAYKMTSRRCIVATPSFNYQDRRTTQITPETLGIDSLV